MKLKIISTEGSPPQSKITFLSIESCIYNSLFLYSILKKENKHINMVFECTIKKTQ